MEAKKDGVAEAEKMVRAFSDKYLPPRPHHLTAYPVPDSKYPPPEAFWFTGESARLQYMTNLSEADRGFLVTLPYYEVMNEPELAQPVKAVVRSEAKKKMSFKEYANRKTKSNSPPATTENAPSANANAKQRAGVEPAAPKEQEKTKATTEERPKDRMEPQSNVKKVDAQSEPNRDSSRSRPPPKQDHKTSSPLEQRKRQLEREEPLPPPKRMRIEETPKEGQHRDSKQSTARELDRDRERDRDRDRGRDRNRERDRDRDRERERDVLRERERERGREKERGRERDTPSEARTTKDVRSSIATNGRLQVPSSDRRQVSPKRTAQVNGARPRADSSTITTPSKKDRGDSSKSSIPPLLSPLRDRSDKSSIPPLLSPLRLPTPNIPPLLSPLRLDNHEPAESPRKRPAGKAPAKGPLSQTGNHSRSTSASKLPKQGAESPRRMVNDGATDTPEKKTAQQRITSKQPREKESQPEPKASKRPPRVPPLLSPTLPPIVEAELARLTRQEASSKRTALPTRSDAPASTKKAKASAASQEEAEGSQRRNSLVVTVKYKKALKPRISQLLQLPSLGSKKAERAERSDSVERTPPSKKRPRPTNEPASEQVFKKSKLSTEQSMPTAKATVTATAAPATPQKNHTATAMSRALSNMSQANTPGDSTGHTPGLPDRPSTSSDTQIDPAITTKITALRNLSDQHMALGSRLKKARDVILRGSNNLSPADEKRAAVMHLEMVLAYLIAFKAMDRWMLLARRPLHIQGWESLLPHFAEMRARTRMWRPLDLLSVQLHGVVLEELTQSFATLDEKQAAGQHVRWARHARHQPKVWREAKVMLEEGGVPDPKLRANISAGSGVDDTVRAALTLLRRWADRESVNWKSEIEVPGAAPPTVNGA